MNEQLLQVVRFLLVPEAALSVFFLVIFMLIFVFGVITYQRNRNMLLALREGASEEYSKVSQKMPPEIFLKRGLERLSVGDDILEGIPEVFVSVGILATFIGLGIAIQEATGLLTAEKFEMEKMIGLLGIIAFKFQTSVWGIAFSLLFRRFGVENYFSFRQKVIDEIRELLHAMERDSVQRLLEKQNDLLENMLLYQQKADKDLDSHLSVLTKEINAQQESLLTRQLEQETTRHVELLTAIKSLEDAQGTGMNGMKEALANIHQRQDLTAKARKLEIEQIHSQIAVLDEHLMAALNEGEVTRKSAWREIGILRQRFDAFEGVTERYVQSAKDFEGMVATFVGQVDNFRQDVITLQKNIVAALDEINSMTQDNLVRMHSHVENLQKVFLRDENQYVAKTREYFQNVLRHSEDAFKNILNESIRNVHESYVQELENFDDVAKGLKRVLDQIDSHLSKMHREMLDGQKTVEAMNKTSCQDLNNMMEAIGKSIGIYQKKLTAVHDKMSNVVTETSKLQSDLIEKQEKLLTEFSVLFTQNIKAIQDTQSNLREGMMIAIGTLDEDIKTTFGNMQKTMAECGDMRPIYGSLQELRADVLRLADVHNQQANALQTALPAQLTDALRGEFHIGEIIAALETLNKKQDAAITLETKLNVNAEQMLVCLKRQTERVNSKVGAARKIGTQAAEKPAFFDKTSDESFTSRIGKSIKDTVSSIQKMVEDGGEVPTGGDKP